MYIINITMKKALHISFERMHNRNLVNFERR